MIDTTKLKEALTAYKNDFAPLTWNEERYKWETVKHFQDNWDVNATDFAVMLENSLAKTDNLLMSQYNYPKNMIVEFAQKDPEQVRSMFINLFDEGQDYYERVKIFKQTSVALLSKYGKAEDNHYQSENVITIYLWLRYPDKYYIFKLGIVRNVAKYLHANYHFKKGAYAENLRNHLALYDELCAELQKDAELVQLLHSQLTPDCYPDSALHTLTIDVGYYISQSLSKQKDANESNMTATVAPAVKDDTSDSYTKADFLTEVYMTEERYDHLTSLLKNKKNVILQGAPGVGKTFCAKRLAWSMIGKKDESRIEFIQFHQNYSYEDFMMGYKPEKQGFKLKYGVFYRFCQQAANHPDKEFFFLILHPFHPKNWDKHTIVSANLYQIFTYVKNKQAELNQSGGSRQVSGMLLYARTDEDIQPDGVYQMSGNQISVTTLDLNCPFEQLSAQLNSIAATHFETVWI